MTRLILAMTLTFTLALPPAKAPSCYLTGNARKQRACAAACPCRCGCAAEHPVDTAQKT